MLQAIIVEDEERIRAGLRKYTNWPALGIRIMADFPDGQAALHYLSQPDTVIDLVISDVCMPNMTGLDLLSQAKAIHPHISFMIISGYGDFEYVQKALQLGANDYILKPIDLTALEERLELLVKEIRRKKTELQEISTLRALGQSEDAHTPPCPTQGDGQEDCITRAKQYIEGNYHDPELSLDTVAKQVFITPSYLSRQFKKQCGTSFVEYLTSLRMEQAKVQLAHSNHYIYEIALNVSYTNTTYFSTIFKRTVGVSPQAYRDLYQK